RDLEAYTQDLDTNDEQENHVGDGLGDAPALADKLEKLKERQARKPAQLKPLEASGETQFSRTDPDARALNKGNQHVTGYNVQSSVDDKHKLIVHHEVTNAGNDQNPLSGQCQAAMEVMSVNDITVVADSGYSSEAQLAACQEANATVYVPIPDKHKAIASQGRLSGKHFHYNGATDAYSCPAGELLPPRGQPHQKNGIRRTRYSRPASQCRDCP
ncbi:transposase, partial [Candidatus Thiosymbion oneisti]